jgi:hypothetical protein
MTKSTISILFIAILSIGQSMAQNDWKPAYMINNEQDTIHGFIENNDSKLNSKFCNFRDIIKGEISTYYPQDISGYRFIDGKFFVSKNIDDPEFNEPVFLEFLIQGKANVYHYLGERYFIEKDNKIHELKNTERLIKTESGSYLNEKKEYIGVLNSLFMDAEIQPDIAKTELKAKSLINTAKIYHEAVCSDEQCIIFEKSIKPVRVKFGLIAGLTYNKISFGKILNSEYSIGYLIGGRFEIKNISPWTDKLGITIDLSLQKFSNYTFLAREDQNINITYNGEKYKLKKTNDENNLILPNEVEELTVDLKTLVLKIPVSISYSFSKSSKKPYIGMGLINMFILTTNKEFVYDYFYYYGSSIPTYHLGLVLRAGYDYELKNDHSLYTEFNYETTFTFNVNQDLRFTNQLFSLNFGYMF